MKIKNLSLVSGVLFSMALNAQQTQDSIFIYDVDGDQHWYHVQNDVFCFKLTDNSLYAGSLNSCVANLTSYGSSTATFNEINFSPSSTLIQRVAQINEIVNSSNYRAFSVPITKSPESAYTEEKFYRTDDQILITFNDPLLGLSDINDFAEQYDLELVHQPSENLPSIVSWTYIFRMRYSKEKDTRTTIELAKIINENQSVLVKLAEPNMYSVEPLSCVPTTEVGLSLAGTNGTWHIRNTGGLIWDGLSGVNDADADICECWGEGYTGQGIKVGIIDFGGIEFNHPDFEGTNIPKAYNSVVGNYQTSNFALDPADGHGMQVTGVIAATPNNTSLGQRWAVGAAYNAEVIPYINQLFQPANPVATNGQISVSIQRAFDEGVDVINMSFRTDAAIGTIGIQLNNATTVGRPDPSNPGVYRGIVCVAAVGNDDLVASHFPANMPNVIGVGWTNPEDYRSSYMSPGAGGAWSTNSGQGSTYGPPEYNYDVVAPGEVIMTTNLSTARGAYYATGVGSSFSSPIVASIAAMILEKNPSLTWTEVRDLIRSGAEKVRTGTYNYNMYGSAPGYNNEMFYGRVSCINSINQTTLNITGVEKQFALTVMNMGNSEYLVFVPESGNLQEYELYDMTGRMLKRGSINSGETEIPVNLSGYSNGMYLLHVYNAQKSILSTKLMK